MGLCSCERNELKSGTAAGNSYSAPSSGRNWKSKKVTISDQLGSANLQRRWVMNTVIASGLPELHAETQNSLRLLLRKIRRRQARVGIIGLGYVGLPLAVEFAGAGFSVTGFDIDRRRTEQANNGSSYIGDVNDQMLWRQVESGRFHATNDFAELSEMDTISICVPTPLRKTKDPDLSYIIQAVEAVADHLHRGQLIILESTTYPGTTEEIVLPVLERNFLKVGEDFFLAFSPERVDPGKRTISDPERTQGGRRNYAALHAGRTGLIRCMRGPRGQGLLGANGRNGEAAREHLPQCQHWTGQ